MPHEIADYVKHVVAVLDALGLPRVHVSGQSLGGWVAGRLAIDHPERVNRLCLNTAGGAHSDPSAMDAILEKTLVAVNNPTHQAVRQRLEFLMHDPASVSDELVATRQASYRLPGMVEATRRILCLQDPATRDRNLIPDAQWRRIAAPTLVVWTTHDPTAPVDVGRRIASLAPDSRFELTENCAHWPQWENREHFNRVHLAFMRGAPDMAGERLNSQAFPAASGGSERLLTYEMDETSSSYYKSVRALSRGLELLRLLSAVHAGRATASELARSSGLHRTTVRRILETLADEAYVVPSPTEDSFRLAVKATELGVGFDDAHRVSIAAIPVLQRLLSELQWPTDICTPSGVQMLISESTQRSSRLSFHPFRELVRHEIPMLRTAAGRAYFASFEEV